MVTSSALVLIHSPLVGPLTWQACSDLLLGRGYSTVVPSLAGVVEAGPPYYPQLAARVAETVHAAVPAQPLVLVGHSGAGALLPAVAAACQQPVEAAVFVDATLPHPGGTWFETAPPSLGERLRQMAVEGWLPPWSHWFPPGTLDPLLPDPVLRARFIAELPHLPLAYFEEAAPTIPDRIPRHGYLQLSEGYAEAAAQARQRGWPTLQEAADHLAILTRPNLVVERLVHLIERLIPTA
jgi:pimeloyl-ACP methyl ester carboxylesterase